MWQPAVPHTARVGSVRGVFPRAVASSAADTAVLSVCSAAVTCSASKSLQDCVVSVRSSSAPVMVSRSSGLQLADIKEPVQETCAVTSSPHTRVTASIPSSSNYAIVHNCYGQVTITSQPTNESEFQLYRVLQHANLLSYYDTFISQGGDDVQQLCEAGEDEFLEIMALVGMAAKPLHVRRLQKALQEWVNCPGRFQVPLLSVAAGAGNYLASSAVAAAAAAARSALPLPVVLPSPHHLLPHPPLHCPQQAAPVITDSSNSSRLSPPGTATPVTVSCESVAATMTTHTLRHNTPSPITGCSREHSRSPANSQETPEAVSGSCSSSFNTCCSQLQQQQRAADSTDTYPSSSSPQALHQVTPQLLHAQVQRLAASAQLVASSLPFYEPRPASGKKKVSRELELVINMSADEPKRMHLLRRYAAIYGRFDCKRRAEKPLTLHEVSVNEAAAQICAHVPALLTRRDELFPLARQVVRHSGYQYSKGHSRSQGAQCYSPRDYRPPDETSNDDELAVGGGGVSEEADCKRVRLDSSSPQPLSASCHVPHTVSDSPHWTHRQERLEQISDELAELRSRDEQLRSAAAQLNQPSRDSAVITPLYSQIDRVNNKQKQLMEEQKSLINSDKQFFKPYMDYDDEDSLGSAASPAGGGCDSSKDEDVLTESGQTSAHKQNIPNCASDLSVVRSWQRKSPLRQSRHNSVIAANSSDAPVFHEQKVVASSAGTIIAVTNPALKMSAVVTGASITPTLTTHDHEDSTHAVSLVCQRVKRERTTASTSPTAVSATSSQTRNNCHRASVVE